MISKNILLQKLSPFKNKKTIVVNKQTVENIVDGILENHKEYANEYDNIYKYFVGNTVEHTLQNIFDFVKYNVPYKIESEQVQTLRSPAAIICKQSGDCKSYATFINGVVDAYRRNEKKDLKVIYRFAGYNNNDNIEHVFAVVCTGEKKYFWIDPVLPTFDTRIKTPTIFFDKIIKPMALVKINGIAQQQRTTTRATAIFPTVYPPYIYAGKRYESVGHCGKKIGDTGGGDSSTWDFLKNISISDIIDYFKNFGLSDGEKMKAGFVKQGLTPNQMLMWYILNKKDDWAFLHQAKEILIWDTPQISYNVADAFNKLIDKPQWQSANKQYEVAFDLSKTNKTPIYLPTDIRGNNYVAAPAPTPTPGSGGEVVDTTKKSSLLPIGLGLLAVKLLMSS